MIAADLDTSNVHHNRLTAGFYSHLISREIQFYHSNLARPGVTPAQSKPVEDAGGGRHAGIQGA